MTPVVFTGYKYYFCMPGIYSYDPAIFLNSWHSPITMTGQAAGCYQNVKTASDYSFQYMKVYCHVGPCNLANTNALSYCAEVDASAYATAQPSPTP